MSQTEKKGWIDGNLFNVNLNKFTYEQLAPYMGQHVAWSTDGTRVVAHHADPTVLLRLLRERGLSGEDYVLDYLPGADEPDTIL